MVGLFQPKIALAFLTPDFNKGFSTHYCEIEIEIQPNPTVLFLFGNLSVINVFSCKLKKKKKTPLHFLFINFRQRKKRQHSRNQLIIPFAQHVVHVCESVCVCATCDENGACQ